MVKKASAVSVFISKFQSLAELEDKSPKAGGQGFLPFTHVAALSQEE
jgi:hypothetical protein